MKSLIVAAVVVLLASSTAFACGCAAPVAVQAYYPATPAVTYYAAPACAPTTAYYPTYYPTYYRAYYPYSAWYAPMAARTWVGPLGRVRTTYYLGW